mgnify:FL=1
MQKDEDNAKKDKENKRLEKAGPNKRMEAGKGLSPKYAADFQKHLIGIPLIDIDPFYKEKEVSSEYMRLLCGYFSLLA